MPDQHTLHSMLDAMAPGMPRDPRITRRLFVRRSSTWMLAGGALSLLAACGTPAASKDDVAALRKEIAALKPAEADPKADAAHGAEKPGAPAAAHDAKHWDYEGEAGPDKWADLAPENAVCRIGSTQSPIDIGASQPGLSSRTGIKWQPTALNIQNNGHTIQADVTNGGAIELDGVPYTLAQFHFHAPSEHTVAGKRFAMETHFVHKNTKGELAVIGVLHDIGAANDALAPVFAALPKTTEEKQPLANFDLAAVLPKDRGMYRYAGSLTTPPCTEGVRWQVLQTPTTISEAQVKAFNAIIKPNARPVQPIKARDVLKDAIYKFQTAG